jgi:hypothetical protein
MHAAAGTAGASSAVAARALLADLELLAPVATLPRDVAGDFAFYVAGGVEPGRLLRVRASDSRLRVVCADSPAAVSGFLVAPAGAWLRSLATGANSGIQSAGDGRSLARVMAALATLTRPGPLAR